MVRIILLIYLSFNLPIWTFLICKRINNLTGFCFIIFAIVLFILTLNKEK